MKKILILLVLLFVPIGVGALEPNYDIDGLYIDATIEADGDVIVREQIVLTGAFNGYVRDLYYKGNYPLYDASKIEDLTVCELPVSEKGIFDLSKSSYTCFAEKNSASKGDKYVYTREDSYDNSSLTMYNYNVSGTKIFYITYTLKNVVVIHNDIAELYWTFIGSGFDDYINDVKITVNLPGVASDLRIWAHGDLRGDVIKEENKRIVATITDLYSNSLVDIRTIFDKSLVPNGTKLSNKNGIDSVLAEEQTRADEANQIREEAKALEEQRRLAAIKEKERIEKIGKSLLPFHIIWIIGAALLAVYVYRKYDKEHKSAFNLEYHREFPAEYGPEVVEYLMKKRISSASLSAMILDIVRKKGFTIREEEAKHGKKEYILVKKNVAENTLRAEEAYIVDWLINDLGNGEEVSLRNIKDASSTESDAKAFIEKYDKWLKLSKMNAQSEDFYEDSVGIKIKGSLYAVLGFILFFTSISLAVESPLLLLTMITSILLFVYVIAFTRRTIKGNDHFTKWKAFKKFLLDFGRFNEKELPEIALWEKYLVYATIFGIADKVSKVMEIKVQSMDGNVGMPIYSHIYLSHYFTSNLVSTVNTARTASVSKIASSSTSSGSGFGGGFSGGGGFGGGGGGGGGHGF